MATSKIQMSSLPRLRIDLQHGDLRSVGRHRRVLQERRLGDARDDGAGAIEDGELLPAAALTIGAGEEAPERAVLAGDSNGFLEALAKHLLERRHVGFVEQLEVEQEGPHLVERLFAEHRPARWVVRIARVAGRVVVGDRHVDARALWQRERLLVEVAVLPVEVPVLDPEQRARRPVGQRRHRLHLPREVVRVSAGRVHLHVRLEA